MLPVWITSILFVSGAANAFYFPTPYPGPWSSTTTTKPVAEKAKPDNTASVSTAVKATSASTSRGSLSDVPYVEAERVAKGPEPKGFAIFPQEFSTEGLKTLPHGFVEFAFTSDTSAHVEIRLTNLPEGRGPFSYHIHNERVPDRITNPAEQCKAAMSHLDPAAIGDAHVCDSEKKASCQAGDLSGKHGAIPVSIKSTQVYKEIYEEPYISWKSGDGNFFVNRSIVIHEAANKGRIACANIFAL